MKILYVTSEFADFAKAGGLGDVSAGLPRALRRRGIDARLLMPAYPEVLAKAGDIAIVAHLPGRGGIQACSIGETRTADGLILYLVLEASLYQRAGSLPDRDLHPRPAQGRRGTRTSAHLSPRGDADPLHHHGNERGSGPRG
jgi:glycogen synthase